MFVSIYTRLNKSLYALFILLLFIATGNQSALATSTTDPDELHLNKLNFCPITKTDINDYEPEIFSKSNNLLRAAGQEAIFCGQRIVVYGKLLDQNCVPVSDAKIYAWQVGCNAKYPYKPLKSTVKSDMYEEKREHTFIGNGTATTNNKGEFIFVTVYPKAVHDMGPHINIRAEHRSLGTLQTSLELHGNRISNPSLNPDLEKLIPAIKESGSAIYEFKVVMPGSTLRSY